MSKSESILRLYQEYREAHEGKEVVLGDGNLNTVILLVGEAPGKDEVKLSKPFVGAAGKNLAEFLEILGMSREDIYITNAIKYRLSKVNEETGRTSNRPATMEEMEESRPCLMKEIEIIEPSYIITLGNVPLKAVTGQRDAQIGRVHGTPAPVTISQKNYTLFPLYHPASIIYNRSLKDVYLEDLGKLKSLPKVK